MNPSHSSQSAVQQAALPSSASASGFFVTRQSWEAQQPTGLSICVGFVLVLSGKPMCIGCLSLGACLLVENYSMKTMESSCSHVRNITCQTSAMTHTREAFAFQGKV